MYEKMIRQENKDITQQTFIYKEFKAWENGGTVSLHHPNLYNMTPTCASAIILALVNLIVKNVAIAPQTQTPTRKSCQNDDDAKIYQKHNPFPYYLCNSHDLQYLCVTFFVVLKLNWCI